MGQCYSHISIVEPEEISGGLALGQSVRAISRRLGRSASSISREISRNARRQGDVSGMRGAAPGAALRALSPSSTRCTRCCW
jgi:IS30 family transposase